MENNAEPINAIIFDCDEIPPFEKKISPYSEKFLKAVSQKYKLAIISRKFFNTEIRVFRRNAAQDYFDVVRIKKNQLIEQYLQCSEKIYSKPEETLVIGENFDNLKIANGRGFQTYLIQNGSSVNESQNGENGQSIKKIKSVDELLRIL